MREYTIILNKMLRQQKSTVDLSVSVYQNKTAHRK